MEIKKIFGFVAPIGKGAENIDKFILRNSEILPENKLFPKLTDLFTHSESECDINICFIPKNDEQKNDARDSIVSLINDFTLENCKPLVRSMIKLTDRKIKEGLLFFIYAENPTDKKLMIARFPSEEAIRVKQDKGECVFEIIDDVFLKNSRKYKAVYYKKSLDDYWSGFAIDRQIGDDNLKEISNYWIKDFLQSKLKMNSLRASETLAKAVKQTIQETKSEQIREELIGITSIIKNVDNKILTYKSFFDKMNLSNQTKDEVLKKIPNPDQHEVSFNFNSSLFSENCRYLFKILDNGAIVAAHSIDFPKVWKEEKAEKGKIRFSTVGKNVKSKIGSKV